MKKRTGDSLKSRRHDGDSGGVAPHARAQGLSVERKEDAAARVGDEGEGPVLPAGRTGR